MCCTPSPLVACYQPTSMLQVSSPSEQSWFCFCASFPCTDTHQHIIQVHLKVHLSHSPNNGSTQSFPTWSSQHTSYLHPTSTHATHYFNSFFSFFLFLAVSVGKTIGITQWAGGKAGLGYLRHTESIIGRLENRG